MNPVVTSVRTLVPHSRVAARTRACWLALAVLLAVAGSGPLAASGIAHAEAEPAAGVSALMEDAGALDDELGTGVASRADIHVFGFVRGGSMMIPVRPTAEAFGASVHWVAGIGTLVNGHLVESTVVLGQSYSPARELAAILGCWIEWREQSRHAVLSNGVQRAIVSIPASSWEEESWPVSGEDGKELPERTQDESGLGAGGAAPEAAQSSGAVILGSDSVGGETAPVRPRPPEGAPAGVVQAELPVVTITLVQSGEVPAPNHEAAGSTKDGASVVVITPRSATSSPDLLPREEPCRGGPGSPPAHERPLTSGKIALTFDDGPDAVYTRKILSILDRHGAKATFFLVGRQVERYPAVVREMAAAGHELGNHGYSHSRLTLLPPESVRREISRTQEAVEAAAKVTPIWFRPPYGSYDRNTRQIAREEGARMVLWTLNPDDWRNPGEEEIIQRVTSSAVDGAVVLLHVRAETASALPEVIEELTSRGFELVGLSDILSPVGGVGETRERLKPSVGSSGGGEGSQAAPATAAPAPPAFDPLTSSPSTCVPASSPACTPGPFATVLLTPVPSSPIEPASVLPTSARSASVPPASAALGVY